MSHDWPNDAVDQSIKKGSKQAESASDLQVFSIENLNFEGEKKAWKWLTERGSVERMNEMYEGEIGVEREESPSLHYRRCQLNGCTSTTILQALLPGVLQ